MASPHVVALSAVGFNSITRTVKNLNAQVAGGITYNDTAQFPQNSAQGPVDGPAFAGMSFDTEMNPSGSSGGSKTPSDHMLFEACGWEGTVNGTTDTTYTWTGSSANVTAVDLSSRVGDGEGYLQPCSSAVGNFSLLFEPRSVPICSWGFTGTYTTPTEATLTDTLTNGGAAPISIGTITLGTDTLVMKRFMINSNNVLNGPNFDMASTNGVASPNKIGGIPTFSTVVEIPAFSTANFVTDWTSQTLTAFSIAIGSGAGYVITVTVKGYLSAFPQLQSVGGNLGALLTYRMDTASGSPIAIAYT